MATLDCDISSLAHPPICAPHVALEDQHVDLGASGHNSESRTSVLGSPYYQVTPPLRDVPPSRRSTRIIKKSGYLKDFHCSMISDLSPGKYTSPTLFLKLFLNDRLSHSHRNFILSVSLEYEPQAMQHPQWQFAKKKNLRQWITITLGLWSLYHLERSPLGENGFSKINILLMGRFLQALPLKSSCLHLLSSTKVFTDL